MSATEGSSEVASGAKEHRRTEWVFGFGLFALALALGVWIGGKRFLSAPDPVLIEVDPQDLDLGDVFVTEAFRLTLPVKNVSDSEVEIADVRSSCDCTSVAPIPLKIPTGDSANLDVSLDLTARSREDATLPSRVFSAIIVPIIKREIPGRYPRWEIRGTVVSPLVFSPALPQFGEDTLVRGNPVKPLEVQVVSNKPLLNLSAASDASLASASVIPVKGETETYRLTITPREDLEPGNHSFLVSFQGVTADGREFDDVPLRVLGEVVEDVQILPPTILMGAVTLGQTVTHIVGLRSRTGRPFEVIGSRCQAGKVLVESLPERDASDQCRFRVTLTASELGSQQSVVFFGIRHESKSSEREVPLRLVYFGRSRQPPTRVQHGE